IIDPETRIIEGVNTFASLLIGEKKKYIIGRKCHMYMCPAQEQCCPVCDKNQEVDNSERILLRADKSTMAVLKTVKRIQIEGKEKLLESFVDITAQKKAEEAVMQSSKKWEAIISASPDGIGMVSLDGKLQLMSNKLAAMYGYSVEQKDDHIGKLFFDFIDPSNHQRLHDNISKLLAGNSDDTITEYLAIKKDKSRFYVDVNSTILLDSKGNPESILFVERDITGRKLTEEISKKSREDYKELFDNAPVGYHEIDNEGKIVRINETELKMLGYSIDEILGKPFWELNADETFSQQSIAAKLSGIHTPLQPFGREFRRKDGTTVPVLIKDIIVKNKEGKITGIRSTVQDITERKRAEEAMNQISTRLALATRAGGVGVWDLDLVNNILLWDDQMFTLYGVEKNNFGGAYETWKAGLHPDDVAQGDKEIQMAVNGEKEFNTEFRVVWPNGSVHNVRALGLVHHDEQGKPIRMIGTNWDITEQKKTEARLLKAKQEAEMANKSKSIFLSNMSHEIRTPLNAIIGFSQLINRDKLLSDSQKEYNTSIIRAGEHLLSLINDILELSKVEAGRVLLNPTNVDLHVLIEDIQMIFKERAQSKHLQFIFETAADLPRFVIVDESKLRQIFVNLIGNAVKFTDEGGIAVRARVDKVNEYTNKLVVEIQDSGTGIPESEITNLFKHFVQTSAGIKKGSGTGLGLVLSRELTMLMGGDITVVSQVGKGSVFTFHVEIQEGKTESVEKTTKKHVICIDKGEEVYRILVVDDKAENLKVVVNLLKLVGFETNMAVNGAEAIVKFEKWNPHLILMDMRMPVMDGYEATRRIKLTKKGRQTPIIALTASSFEEERQKTMALGMHDYIRKPFRENELFSAIGKALNIKYIYEEQQITVGQEMYLNDNEAIIENIAQLPNSLVLQMREALAVADLDLLIDLIKGIESYNPGLAQHLKTYTKNYDYEYLHQILSKKEIEQ
ncbi:MAG: PAS domain S-box protein, partial [Bacteroidota bacterium]